MMKQKKLLLITKIINENYDEPRCMIFMQIYMHKHLYISTIVTYNYSYCNTKNAS
jgi:hypothetical protein